LIKRDLGSGGPPKNDKTARMLQSRDKSSKSFSSTSESFRLKRFEPGEGTHRREPVEHERTFKSAGGEDTTKYLGGTQYKVSVVPEEDGDDSHEELLLTVLEFPQFRTELSSFSRQLAAFGYTTRAPPSKSSESRVPQKRKKSQKLEDKRPNTPHERRLKHTPSRKLTEGNEDEDEDESDNPTTPPQPPQKQGKLDLVYCPYRVRYGLGHCLKHSACQTAFRDVSRLKYVYTACHESLWLVYKNVTN
jgi:hypothetical protein